MKTIQSLYSSISLLEEKSILWCIGQIACDRSLHTVIDIDGHIHRRMTEALPYPTRRSHGSTFSSTSVQAVIVALRLDGRIEFHHSIFCSQLWELDIYLDGVEEGTRNPY